MGLSGFITIILVLFQETPLVDEFLLVKLFFVLELFKNSAPFKLLGFEVRRVLLHDIIIVKSPIFGEVEVFDPSNNKMGK